MKPRFFSTLSFSWIGLWRKRQFAMRSLLTLFDLCSPGSISFAGEKKFLNKGPISCCAMSFFLYWLALKSGSWHKAGGNSGWWAFKTSNLDLSLSGSEASSTSYKVIFTSFFSLSSPEQTWFCFLHQARQFPQFWTGCFVGVYRK